MKKSQIIIVGIAIIAVIFLFTLPKFVLKDQRATKAEKGPQATVSETKEDAHESHIPDKEQVAIDQLRKNYLSLSNKEKKLKFADSLATLFRKVNKFDSSAKYLGEIASLEPKKENLINAGDAYFDASTFAFDEQKIKDLGEQSRAYYTKVLDQDPENLTVKTKLAKTFIGTDDPANTMKGVRLLKEVIRIDPGNEEALFNLGTMSIQSKQFDKAVERFAAIVDRNPKHLEGQFWLEYSYLMLGEKQKAKAGFIKVKTLSNDPQILATVDGYLKDIK